MTEKNHETPEGHETGGGEDIRKKRISVAFIVLALTAIVDLLVITKVVPWAEEISDNPFMSLGYVVTFLTVFVNFLIAIGILAYVLHGDSYPSDRWK